MRETYNDARTIQSQGKGITKNSRMFSITTHPFCFQDTYSYKPLVICYVGLMLISNTRKYTLA